MNEEYGIVHFDEEDAPEDKRLDRKMMTYSFSQCDHDRIKRSIGYDFID